MGVVAELYRMKVLFFLVLGLLLAIVPFSNAGKNIDSDGDGLTDLEDDDDDNDGLLDSEDDDDDGDGIDDADEDDDDDGDGILDGDEDDDGDGLENDEDPDDDGDGVLDETMSCKFADISSNHVNIVN